MAGVVVGADPASVVRRGQRYEVAIGMPERGFGAALYVEQRGPYPRLLDPDHDCRSAVWGHGGVLEAAVRIVHEPAHGLGVLAPHAQFAIGPGLHDEEDPAAVVEPGRRDLKHGSEVQDLAIFRAL